MQSHVIKQHSKPLNRMVSELLKSGATALAMTLIVFAILKFLSSPADKFAIAAVLTCSVFLIRRGALSKLEIVQKELSDLSLTDELTGLKNRRAFNEFADRQLKVASRANQPMALLYMDLDNLKAINDKLGVEAGDRAIREFGQILDCHLRETDLTARLGGDEFCILMNGDPSDVDNALARLNMHVSNRNQYDMEQQFKLQFSVGIVHFDEAEHKDVAAMMKIAEEKCRKKNADDGRS